MEFCKESTHKAKKVAAGCPFCYRSKYSCDKCEGPCIFSKANFERNHKKEFKMKLKSKYYAEEFTTIRSAILSLDAIKGDPTEQERIESLDEYELLEMIHASPESYAIVFGQHATEYNSNRPKKISMYSAAPKMKGRCWWHRTANSHKHFDTFGIAQKPGSRHTRIGNLMKGSEDVVLENK